MLSFVLYFDFQKIESLKTTNKGVQNVVQKYHENKKLISTQISLQQHSQNISIITINVSMNESKKTSKKTKMIFFHPRLVILVSFYNVNLILNINYKKICKYTNQNFSKQSTMFYSKLCFYIKLFNYLISDVCITIPVS